MEKWKTIKDYPRYRVSSLGNIEGLSVWFSKDGYPKISIYTGGKCVKLFVHRMVAEAFIHNPKGKPQVNHKNGIKTDNRVNNLEWCTVSENNQHAYNTGLKNAKGERNGFSKFSKEDVLEIRRLDGTLTRKEIADRYGISLQHLSGIINRKFWKHI